MIARTTLMLALTMGAALLALPPASANHDLCTGNTHQLSGMVSGTVWDGNPDHWLLINTRPATIVTLTPSGGDADLYVLDASCTTVICSSTNSGTTTDACAVPIGAYQVRVLYYFSTSGQVSYTLSAD